jgi:hypothetical protein
MAAMLTWFFKHGKVGSIEVAAMRQILATPDMRTAHVARGAHVGWAYKMNAQHGLTRPLKYLFYLGDRLETN